MEEIEDALRRVEGSMAVMPSADGGETSVIGRRGWVEVGWVNLLDEFDFEFFEARISARMARTTRVRTRMER
jgi:hypothetical protein